MVSAYNIYPLRLNSPLGGSDGGSGGRSGGGGGIGINDV